jgi:thiosulfate reductase/polysulfide reductase chain A
MEVEISRRKFLQGMVALSVVGASALSTTNLLSNEHEHSSSTGHMPKSITTKTGTGTAHDVATLCEMCVNKCAALARVEN